MHGAERNEASKQFFGANIMVPRKVGSAWEVFAPAKLNLYLEILGRRSDGFHDLETLMVPVRIYDHLLWSPSAQRGDGLQVRCLLPKHGRSAESVPADKENLVLRAACLLARRAGVQPWGTFQLFKRIPSQAGMGGGSSDAAAALRLANAAWGIGYNTAQLTELAAELGSDVPFFIAHGSTGCRSAICRGRGERIEPVERLPRLNFVVVKPTVGCSTAEVFQEFVKQGLGEPSVAESSQENLGDLITHLRQGVLKNAVRKMKNRLETIVAPRHEAIERIGRALEEVRCLGHFVTGSGSACVGVVPSARAARQKAGLLTGMNLGSVFATSSC